MSDIDELEKRLQRNLGGSTGRYEILLAEAKKIEARADTLKAENLKLRKALEDLFALIDEGWLVRNINDDAKPGFASRQVSFVKRLSDAYWTLGSKT